MIVYKAVNKLNGRIYVGQTAKPLEVRVYEHYKSSKKPKSIFHKALSKYGVLGFDWIILQDCIEDKAELDRLEIYYQKQYNAVDDGYNMVYMGGGGYNQASVNSNKEKLGKSWEEIYTPAGLNTMQNKVLPILREVGKPYRFDNIPSELQKEYASKGGKSHKGKKESEQTKQNISQGLKKSKKFQQSKQNPEYKKERSIDTKANWANPDSVYNTTEYRDKLRKAKKARFEKIFAQVKPNLQEILIKNVPKMTICSMLGISHPTLQKYIKLL